jgi:hypothetical protein
MKKLNLILLALISYSGVAQDHFAGLNTSSRVGILNTSVNPAELSNMSKRFEVNIFGLSLNVANNKIGYSDLMSDTDLESLLFRGNDPVNMRVDTEIYGLGLAMKYKKWGFAISSKAHGKLDIIDVDPKLGDALVNSALNSALGSSATIKNDYNQRLNGTTWGEVGFTLSRNLVDKEKYKVNVGATFKLLFPGSYANLGLDKFQGTITSNSAGQVYMSNTNASLNIAYSGGLASSFTTVSDYSQSVFGGMDGFATDLGFNYQWKDKPETNPKKNWNKYKLNVGLAVRNIGTMTFKDDNNSSTNYILTIPVATPLNPGLNLNQFNNVDNLQQIETILKNQGYLNIAPQKKDFKVKLPTVFSAYADVKIISKLFITGYIQHKLNDDNANDQISIQNSVTITPRVNLGYFEVYSPWTNNEVSGLNGGIGFRVGGFYLGSGSIVTAVINDSKQADFYTGFRWAFL